MDLKKNIFHATKWSVITEVISKLISPITNMILARMLAPEAFGVLATITMIISFADMFTDAGFQKYIVQHNFKNNKEMDESINVAFWTNLIISMILWGVIALFSEKLAIFLGSPGLGKAISIACIQLPLTSFSSIHMSIYRRNFQFRDLFLVRIVGILIPFIITIPLAAFGFGYWSLIIGSVSGIFSNALILTLKSNWTPRFNYNYNLLKKMLSFSMWSLIEAISIWLTTWIDSFIIAGYLNQYYLGLFKTSTAMVNSIMALVVSSVIPILFSALSRVQHDEILFKSMYYKMQKIVAYVVFPLGMGIYVYREFVTRILLGEQWSEATNIVGIWALSSLLIIVFSNFNSEAYRAKGKPKISFISQVIGLIVIIPTCIITLKIGFWEFVSIRSFIRLQSVITGFIIMKVVMNFSIISTLKNIIKPLICAITMGGIAVFVKNRSASDAELILSIIICIISYCIIIFIVEKDDMILLMKRLKIKEIITLKSKRGKLEG